MTRYYNLDLATANPSVITRTDPLQRWFELVVNPICDLHYKEKQRKQHRENALIIDQALSEYALVRHHTETGEPLDSIYEASKRTGMNETTAPYVRLYVMQIIRFVTGFFRNLAMPRKGSGCGMSRTSEFFAIFNNDDKYLRGRKSWSIYKP